MTEASSDPYYITVREAVESYYLETGDGSFFAVKGMEHPPDRWIAVLRYAPDAKTGNREKNGIRYRRLYRFSEQEQWIRERFPQYRAYDPVLGATLQSVPRTMVRRIYSPRSHFRTLMQRSNRDLPEEDAVAFLSMLQGRAGVPLSSIGITGSMLVGMHTAHSDMDLAVFGEENCRRTHRALHRLLDDGCEEKLSRLNAAGMEELYAQRVVDTQMDFRDFAELESRKANQGSYRGRTWFVRHIKEPGECREQYGSCRYNKIGRIRIRASIADDADAIFTPCRYRLSGVEKAGARQMPEPAEIVSFRGRFCEQARKGDRVLAAGALEQVLDGRGDVRHRLLLGNSPEDTMIVLK